MTVVLVDPRRPSLVPVEAVALLAGAVVAASGAARLRRRERAGAAVLGPQPSDGEVASRGGRAGDQSAGPPAGGASGRCGRHDGPAPHGGTVGERADPRFAAPVSARGDLRAVRRGTW